MAKPRILIVEDSSSATKRFLDILSRSDDCVAVGNGKEAFDLVSESRKSRQHFDVIIIDIIMPIMDGLTAVKEIRRLERSALPEGRAASRILIVSKVCDPEEILLAQYQCVADGYITKPFAKSTVLQTIVNLGVNLPD